MEVELSTTLCKNLATCFKYLGLGGHETVVVQMRSKQLGVSCVSSTLSSAYILTISADQCLRYRFSMNNDEKSEQNDEKEQKSGYKQGCKLSLTKLASSIKNTSLAFTNDILLTFAPTSVILTSRLFNDTREVTEKVNVMSKLYYEEAPFLRATHPQLLAFSTRLSILACTLRSHLKSLDCPTQQTLQMDVHPEFGCLLQTRSGTGRGARLLVDQNDWIERHVNQPVSLILPVIDLWTMCQVGRAFNASISIYMEDGVPVIIELNSSDNGIYLKVVISPLPGNAENYPKNQPGHSSMSMKAEMGMDYVPDSLDNTDHSLDGDGYHSLDNSLEIPATPEYQI